MTNTNSKLLPLNTYKKHNISYQSRTEATKMAPTGTKLLSPPTTLKSEVGSPGFV